MATIFEDSSPLSRIPTFRPDARGKALGTWKLADAMGKQNNMACLFPNFPLKSTVYPLGSRSKGNNLGLMFVTDKGDMGAFAFHEDHEAVAKFAKDNPLEAIAEASLETLTKAYQTNLCYAGKWRMEKSESKMNIKVKVSSFVNIKDENLGRFIQHCRPQPGQAQGNMITTSPVSRSTALTSSYEQYTWTRLPPSEVNSGVTYLVGAWDVRSFHIVSRDGSKKPLLSERPIGTAFFDPQGYFGLVAVDPSAPAVGVDSWAFQRMKVPSDNIKGAYSGSMAYYGTYSLADDKVTQRLWHCSFPNWSDKPLIQTVSYDKVANLLTLETLAGGDDLTKGAFGVSITMKKKLT